MVVLKRTNSGTTKERKIEYLLEEFHYNSAIFRGNDERRRKVRVLEILMCLIECGFTGLFK